MGAYKQNKMFRDGQVLEAVFLYTIGADARTYTGRVIGFTMADLPTLHRVLRSELSEATSITLLDDMVDSYNRSDAVYFDRLVRLGDAR